MEKEIVLLLYKPDGVLSTFTGEPGQETLKKYVDVPGVYAAGRLDQDSEGLLVLSNAGDLIHRLTDPKHHLPKTYLVQVEGIVTPAAIAQLENGIVIQGRRTRPAQVLPIAEPLLPAREKPVTPHGPVAWLRVVLREGRKRQIRHMTAAVGLPTLRIVRVAIGPLALGELRPGQYRQLSEEELAALRKDLSHPVGAD